MYAVIVKEKIHIEGDERSRTNPGHGYPAHTIEVPKFIEFSDDEKFQKWYVDNQKTYAPVEVLKVIRFEEITVTLETTVKVEVNNGN